MAPFLVAAMGFAGFLAAGGLATLRSGVLPRWIGAVTVIGAVGSSIAFLTTLDGTADGSVFGYGFFPGIVGLVTWSVVTSITSYRATRRAGDVAAVIEAHP